MTKALFTGTNEVTTIYVMGIRSYGEDEWRADSISDAVDDEFGFFVSKAAAESRLTILNERAHERYLEYKDRAAKQHTENKQAYTRKLKEYETEVAKNKVLRANGFSTTPPATPKGVAPLTVLSFEDWLYNTRQHHYVIMELSRSDA